MMFYALAISMCLLLVTTPFTNKSQGQPAMSAKQLVFLDQESTRKQSVEPPQSLWLSGDSLKAFVVAYEAFKKQKEIPETKRRIENYTVFFSQTDGNYLVSFMVKRQPRELEIIGSPELKLGRDVTYAVNKNFVLDRWYFPK